jgi:hypothetical protein
MLQSSILYNHGANYKKRGWVVGIFIKLFVMNGIEEIVQKTQSEFIKTLSKTGMKCLAEFINF